jgi:hypothetical protein
MGNPSTGVRRAHPSRSGTGEWGIGNGHPFYVIAHELRTPEHMKISNLPTFNLNGQQVCRNRKFMLKKENVLFQNQQERYAAWWCQRKQWS